MIMQDSRAFLRKIGMPDGDANTLPESNKRFSDGGQYRFEVFGIQNPTMLRCLLHEIKENDLVVHRITQTDGIMNLTDFELQEMICLADENEVELLLAVGPRATTDISSSVNTPKGAIMGLRLRGQEQIVRAMEDVKRGIKFGARNFLVYDEGSLWVFNKMREMGEIPKECHFKFSASAGYGNPCSMKFIEEAGANSINPVWDLDLAKLASIREAIDIPIDVHMVVPKLAGGFIRYYEAPDMIKVAAPIYLKVGATNNAATSAAQIAKEKTRQILLVKERIEQYYPEAKMSSKKF